MMYFKLALRNAKRAAFDYLLYIFTATILVAVMCVSNCIAALGKVAAGFQTASLPLLIVCIMVLLVGYMNDFMLKQRAKEFATYMLLGMEKRTLARMFFLEMAIIGVACFFLGVVLGLVVYYLCFSSTQAGGKGQLTLGVMPGSSLQTFAFFCLAELLAAFRMKRKLYPLQIHQLMHEKHRNQMLPTNKPRPWGAWLIVSFFAYLAMLCGVVFIPDHQGDMLLSFLAIPMLVSVFAFYKWVYAYFSAKRAACSEKLYQGTRLYSIAEITSNATTSASMNFVFCSCVLFSAMSFVFGSLLLNPGVSAFSSASQQWMGFLQISICIIFIVIYFSVLSSLQIIELKQQIGHLKILHYMGENKSKLKTLVRKQILVKLFLPTVMCFVLLGISAPLVNRKLNAVFSAQMHNAVLNAFGGFLICFIVLYIGYFIAVDTVLLHKQKYQKYF